MNQDFLDLLRAFEKHKVEYLLVGAFAVAVHAEPRATGDIDLWIRANPDGAKKVYAALAEFGAPLEQLTEKDLAEEPIVFQMGVAPNRIDILTQLSGLTFELAWQRRIYFELQELKIPVICRDDLITNKIACGRPKDKIDLELLMKHQANNKPLAKSD